MMGLFMSKPSMVTEQVGVRSSSLYGSLRTLWDYQVKPTKL